MTSRAMRACCALAMVAAACKPNPTDTGVGGSGRFSGALAVADISGLHRPILGIAGATLNFMQGSTSLGIATSAIDGSWTSPVLAGGITYTIQVSAAGEKDFPIIVPLVPTPRNIGTFGMVAGSTASGEASLHLSIGGTPLRASPGSASMAPGLRMVAGTVEIYNGVYLAASDPALVSQTASFGSLPATLDFDGASGDLPALTIWGPVTVRVIIPGFTIPDSVVYFDNPSASITMHIATLAPNSVASIGLSPSSIVADSGASVQIVATPLDSNQTALVGRVVTWLSSDTAAATVSASGMVLLKSQSIPVTITATSEGVSGTVPVIGARALAVQSSRSVGPSNISQYFYVDATGPTAFSSARFTAQSSTSNGVALTVFAGFPTGTPACNTAVFRLVATCVIPGPLSGRYVVVLGPNPAPGSLIVQ